MISPAGPNFPSLNHLIDFVGFEKIYLNLPVAMQNVACSLEGWRIKKNRFGSEFIEELALAEFRGSWLPEELIKFRNDALVAFVRSAASTVPYYRRMFARLKLQPNDIKSPDDLLGLPTLDKATVRREASFFLNPIISVRSKDTAHTSGTTGSSLRFPQTQSAIARQWAIWWRYRRWHSISLHTPCAYFGGRTVVPPAQLEPPFWRFNLPGRQILFSGYHLNDRTVAAYVDLLRRLRPPWFHGYPSSIALLASLMLDKGLDIGYQVSQVTTGAENLLPAQVEAIERAFGIRPRQHYGMAEGVANISECERGRLHVDEDFAFTEFIRSNEGSLGTRIIGTNFSNPAFPLIRYDVGDTAETSEEACQCGRPGRIVARLDGRLEDYVVLANGTRVGRLDHVFKDLSAVQEAQIVQRRIGEITVRIVPNQQYSSEHRDILIYELRERLGDGVDITIELVSKLERSVTGKLRFVVSEVGRIEAI